MVRAVRLAATLGFDDRAGDAGGDPGTAEPRRSPVGRADRDRARQAARGAGAVGRAAAHGRHRPARGDLAGARRPARDPPEQDRRARTCGTTRCGPSTRRRGAGRSSGWPRCSTTSASRRPSPTAISWATTSVGAELAGAFLDRLRWPRAIRERVVELVRHHMFSYEPSWSDAAVRRFIAKVGARRGALDELLALREADNVGSGLARRRGGWPSSGRGSPPSWRPVSSSTGAGWRSTART